MPFRDYAAPQSLLCRTHNSWSSDRPDISSRRRMRIQDATDRDPEVEQAAEPENGISAPERRLQKLFPPSAAGYETYEMGDSAGPSVSSF